MYNSQSFDLEQIRRDNPRSHVSKPPFEHQREAFEKLTDLFTFNNPDHKAGILVLPTGAGKTFTCVSWICRNVLPRNVKVLWLAHTGHLLEQAYDTFRSNLLDVPARRTINMRLVSSDPEHSNASQIETCDDVLIITTQTAISNTEPRTLDETGQPRRTAFERFLDHSRQSRLFVVLDEAHHAPAFGCRNLLIGGSGFAEGIRQKVPNAYFLGLTATPSYSDARRRAWLWEIFKDRIIYQAEKADLVQRNILAIPKYTQRNTGREIAVDDTLYERLMRQHKDLPEDLIERLAHDSGRNDYIVSDYLDHYETYGKTIIFADRWFQCVYIKEKLMQKAQERGITLRVDAVYSHVDARANTVAERNQRNSAENTRILHEFKANQLDVLLNVKMLAEGTDVPDVRTVFVTRETTSSILLTQMIGRALRGKAAGGGAQKDVANIVFFVDNWKQVINFATPETGGLEEGEPRTRGAYPLEYISIKLVEDLSRQLDSGKVFSSQPYLDGLPVGWYETEVLASNGEETETYREFVIVSQERQPRFECFLQHLLQDATLAATWEDDNLNDEFAQQQAALWIAEFFDLTATDSSLLDADLIKLARHVAQARRAPQFYSFEDRDKHDLSKIADELLQFNEFTVQDKLYDMYHDSNYQWQGFYKSYDRFKTAFDAERNRIFHVRKFGSEPTVQLAAPVVQALEQRELTEEEKEQVYRRDGYTCLCCGKQKEPGRRVKFEVDHITPFRFGGETSLNNSQTLCSLCHRDKSVNAINFRVLKSPLTNPKAELEFKRVSSAEYIDEELKRIINMFYYCKAVANINWDHRPRSKYRYNWEIELFEGNNPAWLAEHKPNLLDFVRLQFPQVQDLVIR